MEAGESLDALNSLEDVVGKVSFLRRELRAETVRVVPGYFKINEPVANGSAGKGHGQCDWDPVAGDSWVYDGDSSESYSEPTREWVPESKERLPDHSRIDPAKAKLNDIFAQSPWYTARYLAGEALGSLILNTTRGWLDELIPQSNSSEDAKLDLNRLRTELAERCNSLDRCAGSLAELTLEYSHGINYSLK